MILAIVDEEGTLMTFPMDRLFVGAQGDTLVVGTTETKPGSVYQGEHAALLRDILITFVDEALNTGRSPRAVDLRTYLESFKAPGVE